MKFWFAALLAAAIMANGCAFWRSEPAEVAGNESAPDAAKMIVTPENLLVGKVSTYNAAGRFVVLDFPVGRLPSRDLLMFVYRDGLKVGEVKITGPERDHNTVADLQAGEARKGDEVRDK